MEEFLSQAKEFNYSFWGGLFFFIGGLLMTVTLPFIHIQRRLWFSILCLFPGAFFSVRLFYYQHSLFGSLLAITVLAVGVVIIIVGMRKKIQTGKP